MTDKDDKAQENKAQEDKVKEQKAQQLASAYKALRTQGFSKDQATQQLSNKHSVSEAEVSAAVASSGGDDNDDDKAKA